VSLFLFKLLIIITLGDTRYSQILPTHMSAQSIICNLFNCGFAECRPSKTSKWDRFPATACNHLVMNCLPLKGTSSAIWWLWLDGHNYNSFHFRNAASNIIRICRPFSHWLRVPVVNNSMVWVRERTIPTERPPIVGEVISNFMGIKTATWSAWRIPTAVFSGFLDRSRYFSIK
jgi:hypothetical protein